MLISPSEQNGNEIVCSSRIEASSVLNMEDTWERARYDAEWNSPG